MLTLVCVVRMDFSQHANATRGQIQAIRIKNDLFIRQDSASSVNIRSYSYNGNLSYYDCHLIIYTIVDDGQRRKIKIIDSVYVPQYMLVYFARINIKQRF